MEWAKRHAVLISNVADILHALIILNANKAVGCGIFRRFSHFNKCRPEAASDVVSGRFVGPTVVDKRVKFHDASLNRSREIPPEAVRGGIFD